MKTVPQLYPVSGVRYSVWVIPSPHRRSAIYFLPILAALESDLDASLFSLELFSLEAAGLPAIFSEELLAGLSAGAVLSPPEELSGLSFLASA